MYLFKEQFAQLKFGIGLDHNKQEVFPYCVHW